MPRSSTTYRSTRKADLAKIDSGLRKLVSRRLVIGITDSARTPSLGEKDPPSNATLGYLMETGSPSQNIPARPFLGPGVAAAQPKINAHLRQAIDFAIQGKDGAAIGQMGLAGQTGVEAVKSKMETGPFVPLSPKTIRARRREGRTGSKPLIDTRQLQNAVGYELRGKK